MDGIVRHNDNRFPVAPTRFDDTGNGFDTCRLCGQPRAEHAETYLTVRDPYVCPDVDDDPDPVDLADEAHGRFVY
jgi:hypothetical protein